MQTFEKWLAVYANRHSNGVVSRDQATIAHAAYQAGIAVCKAECLRICEEEDQERKMGVGPDIQAGWAAACIYIQERVQKEV